MDGVIRDGVGFVSEAPVSGEPFAVVRRPGDRVLAGAASHDAAFRIEATAAGTERQVDRLLAAVEEARDRPVSLQAQADRVGRCSSRSSCSPRSARSPTGRSRRGLGSGLFNAMSVLLVACPCVIGLATPGRRLVRPRPARGARADRAGRRRGRAAGRGRSRDLRQDRHADRRRFALLDIATAATGEERARLLGWLVAGRGAVQPPGRAAVRALPRPGRGAAGAVAGTVPGCGVEAESKPDGARHTLHIGRPEWVASRGPRSDGARLPAAGSTAAGHRIDVALDGGPRPSRWSRSGCGTRPGGDRRLPPARATGRGADRRHGRAAAALDHPDPGRAAPGRQAAAVEAAKAAGGGRCSSGTGSTTRRRSRRPTPVALSSGTDLAVGASAVTLYHTDLRVPVGGRPGPGGGPGGPPEPLPGAGLQPGRDGPRRVRDTSPRRRGAAHGGVEPLADLLVHPDRGGPDHCATMIRRAGGVQRPKEDSLRGLTPTRSPGTLSMAPRSRSKESPSCCYSIRLGVANRRSSPGSRSPAGPRIPVARWATIPHTLDMCFGMLTLGNLGMLLGWWADNGFAPLHEGSARLRRGDARGQKPWMWVGMLVFANAAMLWLARRPAAGARSRRGDVHRRKPRDGGRYVRRRTACGPDRHRIHELAWSRRASSA